MDTSNIGHIHNQYESNYIYLCFGKQRLPHWHYSNNTTQLDHKLLTAEKKRGEEEESSLDAQHRMCIILQRCNNMNWGQNVHKPHHISKPKLLRSQIAYPSIFRGNTFYSVEHDDDNDGWHKNSSESKIVNRVKTQADNLLADNLNNSKWKFKCSCWALWSDMQQSLCMCVASTVVLSTR